MSHVKDGKAADHREPTAFPITKSAHLWRLDYPTFKGKQSAP